MTGDERAAVVRDWVINARNALRAATRINERMLGTGRVESLNLGNHDRLVAESAAVLAALDAQSGDAEQAGAAPGADAVRALDEVERGLRQVSMPPEVREDAYRVLAEVRAAADTGGEQGAGG